MKIALAALRSSHTAIVAVRVEPRPGNEGLGW